MGPFGAIERPWKPFNPILGETFEYHKPSTGIKYLVEQVCRRLWSEWESGVSSAPQHASGPSALYVHR